MKRIRVFSFDKQIFNLFYNSEDYPLQNYWSSTGPTNKVIEYYQNCFQKNANKELSDLLLHESPIKIKTDMIQNNATMEILKKNPSLFLFQAGYLTFANYENKLENTFKIPNNDVRSSLIESIFETLRIRSQFTVEQFEAFLNQTLIFFNLSESKCKEEFETEFNETRTKLEKFFVDTMKEVQDKSGKIFNQKTYEKNLTNYFYLFLNNLNWKNWVSAYQAEILIHQDEIRKPDFLFSNLKEETEIIIEFMKSDWEKHLSRNYQEKTKFNTKKIIVIYYMFKNFNKIKKFGIRFYRREKDNLKLLFEKID